MEKGRECSPQRAGRFGRLQERGKEETSSSSSEASQDSPSDSAEGESGPETEPPAEQPGQDWRKLEPWARRASECRGYLAPSLRVRLPPLPWKRDFCWEFRRCFWRGLIFAKLLPLISRNAMSYSPEDVSGRWKLGGNKKGTLQLHPAASPFLTIRNVYLRQLLTDVQDMVADALKIGEHFRIEHAGLIRTEGPSRMRVHLVLVACSVMSSIYLSAAATWESRSTEIPCRFPSRSKAARLVLRISAISALAAGEKRFLFLRCAGVLADVHGVVADCAQIAGDTEEGADLGGIFLVVLIDDYMRDIFGNFLVEIVKVFLCLPLPAPTAGALHSPRPESSFHV